MFILFNLLLGAILALPGQAQVKSQTPLQESGVFVREVGIREASQILGMWTRLGKVHERKIELGSWITISLLNEDMIQQGFNYINISHENDDRILYKGIHFGPQPNSCEQVGIVNIVDGQMLIESLPNTCFSWINAPSKQYLGKTKSQDEVRISCLGKSCDVWVRPSVY